jgi:hypothetical protein
MDTIDLADYRIERLVDELFGSFRHGENCRNPVTGAGYIHGVDPIAPQKEVARRGLLAREWFADYGPPDLQPLPLGYNERELLKHGGLDHILAWYARSLECRNYDVLEHPAFDDYARGVMASEFCPSFIKTEDETGELRRRFPPRPLEWLNNAMVWDAPKQKRRRLRSTCRTRAVANKVARTDRATGSTEMSGSG